MQKTNPALLLLGVILFAASSASLQAADTFATNTASTNASTTNTQLTMLSPITVIAWNTTNNATNGVVEGTDFRNPGGFGPIDSKAATRTYTPNMENPVSVQVVSQEVMKSEQNIYLDDAIQNVAGVTPTLDMMGLGDSYAIRGVDMQNMAFEDGLKVDNGATMMQRSIQNMESVEVVKGPSSVLYGQMLPGGLVNMDTKKPLNSNYFAVDQQLGSFAFYRTTVDASGPLNEDKTLLYRFNIDQQNNWSYRDFIHNQRFFMFPTFQWKPNDKTQATLEFTYAQTHQVADNGIPFQTNGIPVSVVRSANYAMPWANTLNNEDFNVKLSATHKFNDDWMLHGAVREDFQNASLPNWNTYSTQAGFNGNPGDLGLWAGNYPWISQWTQEFLADLTGKFKTWFIKHTVVLGGDFYHENFSFGSQYGQGVDIINNIYTPNYNQPNPTSALTTYPTAFQSINDAAFFAQDQLELPGHVFGLAGFRYDALAYANSNPMGGGGSPSYYNAVTPRFGLLWRPVEPVSIYGSYTANFGPSSALITTSGAPLPPQSAQQWEIGLKGETPNKKLSSTLSFYQLTQENLPQLSPTGNNTYIAVGQARSTGMEYQLTGEVLPGWKIIGSYSYINAVITQGSSVGSGLGSQVGQRLTGIPYSSGSVWSIYEVQHGPLKKLQFGAGAIYRSQELAYAANSTGSGYLQEEIPGFATLNLMAAYPFNVGKTKWTAQVNVNNVLNTYYYSGIAPNQAMPAAPVNFMASLKAEF
jgi:iron complex outermembrane receptor protein